MQLGEILRLFAGLPEPELKDGRPIEIYLMKKIVYCEIGTTYLDLLADWGKPIGCSTKTPLIYSFIYFYSN